MEKKYSATKVLINHGIVVICYLYERYSDMLEISFEDRHIDKCSYKKLNLGREPKSGIKGY